jgi:hypothetical protein
MCTRGRVLLQLSCLAVTSLGIGASAATASALWAVGGGNNSLYPINVVTGAVGTAVAISGGPSDFYTDLAGANGSQGVVTWAVSGFTAGNRLWALDPVTKQILSSVTMTAPQTIWSLAIDPLTGEFYGASTTSLYRIAPATGTATLMGATPLAVDKALGFDLAGNLYGIANQNQLVKVTKATGATSLVTTLGVTRMEDIAARPETGVMYGIGFGANYSLYQINLMSGALVNLGNSLLRPDGLAFAAVPEQRTLMLAAMAVAFFIPGALRRH